MFRNALAGLAVTAALLLPAPAAVADEAMPARMTSCTVMPATMDRRIEPPETIRVSFMITGDVPADLVRFVAAGSAGGFREFTIHGLFSKTVMISSRELHSETPVEGHPLPRGVECRLTYIHFVDGSSWSAEDLSP
ncbi:MAG TPA: hypothetical protein VGG70_05455 [Candidatus Cybelea sp.]|jgi:hypothetical protein